MLNVQRERNSTTLRIICLAFDVYCQMSRPPLSNAAPITIIANVYINTGPVAQDRLRRPAHSSPILTLLHSYTTVSIKRIMSELYIFE